MCPCGHDSNSIEHYLWRAGQIYQILQAEGTLQVRWHQGRVLSFAFPAPRGYGVRGKLIGIYWRKATYQRIEDDLTAFLMNLSDTRSPITS